MLSVVIVEKSTIKDKAEYIKGLHKRFSVISIKQKDSGDQIIFEIEHDTNELPSLADQVANFASALTRHTLDKLRDAPKDVVEKRTALCKECEFMRKDERCSVCGCFMQRKALWNTSKCPLKKW